MSLINKTNGYYGETTTVLNEFEIEEINNPSSKELHINAAIVTDIQELVLQIYARDQAHRLTLENSTFSKLNVHRSAINSDHLWLVFKQGKLVAYLSGSHIYTDFGEQVYVFKACMVADDVNNKAELFSRLYARQIIRGVLSYWNSANNLGKPMPFITRTLNPSVMQTVYSLGTNMYPGFDDLPINDRIRDRHRAFEKVINESIGDDGILVNSFMKHSDYQLRPTKGKSLRSKIYSFCRDLGETDGAVLTGELVFGDDLIRHLKDKSSHDQMSMGDLGLVNLLRDSGAKQEQSSFEGFVMGGYPS
ncbi:hypothetical protein L2719_03605 [Shewanella schlegeliana]|uniref:GNAT family N-acetyltransferase n=1 Tax=Shewanella schlegeliana TaxID=190308 RepID=A0ABS1SZK7_9GAMM|nr:hypothetical protein [Shewanella schlegeliana]MBL4913977.1 hypothetical protein [Shewanella schlegeliana]MCL1108639.1 hypothetical protein [Shewanella schlegeliana]GIU35510.1 hypothetical protein TUM4433_32980 [Shewanella schlegeliana]